MPPHHRAVAVLVYAKPLPRPTIPMPVAAMPLSSITPAKLSHAVPLRVCPVPMLSIAWLIRLNAWLIRLNAPLIRRNDEPCPRHAFPSPCLAFPSHRRATAMCCRSIPSQRRPMPCLFISKLSPCYALFLHSMPLRRWTPPLLINAARTPPLRIIAMLCHRSDILRLAIAGINSALPSQCFTSPRSALAPRCGAMPLPWLGSPLRFNANPSPCTVTLNYSIPLPNIALALPYYAAPRLCDHSIAIPLLCLSTQN